MKRNSLYYQTNNQFNSPKVTQKQQSSRVGKYLTPFQRKFLEKSLLETSGAKYLQRIKIMLLADEGKKNSEICQELGCSPTTVSRWVHIAKIGQAHCWQEGEIGRPSVINEEILTRLRELVKHNPRDYGYSFERWTTNWLSKHLAKEFGKTVCDRRISQLLKEHKLSIKVKERQNKLLGLQQNQNSEDNNFLIRDLPMNHLSEFENILLFV
jgi:transposase